MGLIILYFLGALSLSFLCSVLEAGGITFYSDVVYLDEGESRQQDCLTDETV